MRAACLVLVLVPSVIAHAEPAVIASATMAAYSGPDASCASCVDEATTLIAAIEAGTQPPQEIRRAVVTLGERRERRAVTGLTRLLFWEPQSVSFAPDAALALFQIGPRAADALLPIVARTDTATFEWARSQRVRDYVPMLRAAEVLADLGDRRAEAPLIGLLSYDAPLRAEKILVRKLAATALGRLRSKTAIKPLMALMHENDVGTRERAARALADIGAREALGTLARAAAEGEWAQREPAIDAFTMLGTSRERATLQKMAEHEEQLIVDGCAAHANYAACREPSREAERFVAIIHRYGLRLDAARECKQNPDCWSEKLNVAAATVRQRAVVELGHHGSARHVAALLTALRDSDPAVPALAVQSLEWMLAKDPGVRAKLLPHTAELQKLADESNESVREARLGPPLRRILFRVHQKR